MAETRRRGRTLVTGGARSGKSQWAEGVLAGHDVVDYLATSEVPDGDPEWARRVALHRARRPASWRTIETLDVAGVLAERTDVPLLVDCLAVWLARTLTEVGAWERPFDECAPALAARTDALVGAVRDTRRDVVFVTNEVGSGIVPESAGTRLYRDELGRLNARVAAECDDVWLCVVGIPRRIK